jgi:ABC-type sulfate transport system permease component
MPFILGERRSFVTIPYLLFVTYNNILCQIYEYDYDYFLKSLGILICNISLTYRYKMKIIIWNFRTLVQSINLAQNSLSRTSLQTFRDTKIL